jgi:hypothetical protein
LWLAGRIFEYPSEMAEHEMCVLQSFISWLKRMVRPDIKRTGGCGK